MIKILLSEKKSINVSKRLNHKYSVIFPTEKRTGIRVLVCMVNQNLT